MNGAWEDEMQKKVVFVWSQMLLSHVTSIAVLFCFPSVGHKAILQALPGRAAVSCRSGTCGQAPPLMRDRHVTAVTKLVQWLGGCGPAQHLPIAALLHPPPHSHPHPAAHRGFDPAERSTAWPFCASHDIVLNVLSFSLPASDFQ